MKALPLARPASGDCTNVQARLFLLEEGLRRAERRGAEPAAALLISPGLNVVKGLGGAVGGAARDVVVHFVVYFQTE